MEYELKWLLRAYCAVIFGRNGEKLIPYPDKNRAIQKTLFQFSKVLIHGGMLSSDTKKFLLFFDQPLTTYIRMTSYGEEEKERYLACYREIELAQRYFDRILDASIVDIIQIENELMLELGSLYNDQALTLKGSTKPPIYKVMSLCSLEYYVH